MAEEGTDSGSACSLFDRNTALLKRARHFGPHVHSERGSPVSSAATESVGVGSMSNAVTSDPSRLARAPMPNGCSINHRCAVGSSRSCIDPGLGP
jgi:hypothetical protein